MAADRMELDPCGQELRGSTVAGEISSVNHRTSPPAQSVERRVGLINDKKRANKREADVKSRQKKKQMEELMMKDLKRQEKCSGELELENNRLKWKRDRLEVDVQEENRKIINQLPGILVEQNTEINTIGERSMSHDGLNNQREMNQAPITSNTDTIFGENASMNLQTLALSARPAGSCGLADDKQGRKKIADKKYRDRKKRMLDAIAARIKELNEKNVKLESDNAVLKAEANQLQKHLDQLRNIRDQMNSKISQLKNGLLGFPLPFFGIEDEGNTSFLEDMDWLMDGYSASQCFSPLHTIR